MFFWNFLAFLMIQQILAIWSLVPLPFLKPAWFTYCWSLTCRIEYYFTSMWDECNCAVVWAFFGIAFLRDWNENGPFPVLWPLLSCILFSGFYLESCIFFTLLWTKLSWSLKGKMTQMKLTLYWVVVLPIRVKLFQVVVKHGNLIHAHICIYTYSVQLSSVA